MKCKSTAPVRLMGVINVSPESFYKNSVQTLDQDIARAARTLTAEGADFIDVGAMSTAPYLSTQISEDEETRRLVRAVSLIKKNSRLPISVDTSRNKPALAALEAGAEILNDVTGLHGDPQIFQAAKKAKGLILMAHPMATNNKKLFSPISDTKKILIRCLKKAFAAGIKQEKIILDPGIGFFRKTSVPWWQWDLAILKNLDQLTSLPCPLLVGVSRKSFIGHLLGGKKPEDRLAGSLAATVVAVLNGAAIIRTHDVAATKEAVQLAQLLK